MKSGLFFVLFLGVSLPLHAQSNAGKATQLNNQAINLSREARYDEALRLMNEASALDPESERIVVNKSGILLQALRYSDALAEVNNFLLRFPHSPEVRQQRVTILELLRLSAESHYEHLKLLAETGSSIKDDPLEMVRSWAQISSEMVTPQKDEIRLDGFFQSSANGTLELETYVFALPNGRFNMIAGKRKKSYCKVPNLNMET